VGIYIGDGYVIEAMGTRYGVVKTRVANRNWTGWCKSPYITYVEEAEEEEAA
jgi:cell wall-associated NlpC family hydrolase